MSRRRSGLLGSLVPSFEQIISRPKRISEAIEHAEKIPFFGEIISLGEDVIPELAVAREALAEVVDIEDTLKSKFGIDVEHNARNLDDAIFGLNPDEHSNTVQQQAGSILHGLSFIPIPKMAFSNISHSTRSVLGDVRGAVQKGISLQEN